ncbi:MAG: DJ-1/PfpI family protein [Caldilineaceae bacterium]|nr:DJ-1/PfpI family protein [Caldilineaceae bacterium]
MLTAKRLGIFIARTVGYVATFAVPVLILSYLVMMKSNATLIAPPPPFDANADLPRPIHDPGKPTVAILASNEGTEITDLLAPFEVFAASEAFNVYTVAPQRIFTPFLWGGVDMLPDYSFAELDELLGGNPDVIVIPFIQNPENPEIVEWIRDRAGEKTLVVSICGGAHTLAETGLVDGGKVTSHHNYLPLLESRYPQLELVRNVRYTDNGRTITSAGITAGIDASLYAIQKLMGIETAVATAHKLHYPHVHFLESSDYDLAVSRGPQLARDLNASLILKQETFGVYLFDEVGEIDLTALLDSYGRTYTAHTVTVAPERKAIRSRHGLYLVPRVDFASAPRFDRILVPGDASAPVDALMAWLQREQRLTIEFFYPQMATDIDTPPFAFDVTLTDLARRSSTLDAQSAALSLEYPTEHLTLAVRQWPLLRLLPALLIGALSLGSLLWLEYRWRARRVLATAAQ